MTFRIGQKVVCVDASPYYCTPRVSTSLRLNAVYTIRALHDLYGITCVSVEEIEGGIEHAFAATRFRPVVTRKTDISIFTKLLTPTEPERVRNTRELCGND